MNTTVALPRSIRFIIANAEAGGIGSPQDAVTALRPSGLTVNDLAAWSDFGHPVLDG